MKTLILPCAGRSSRFPNMKPKYLLTHPSGKLMIEKAIEGIDLEQFNRIIITIVKDHCKQYHADSILKQVFSSKLKIELIILDKFTSCQAETIALTIEKACIEGEFWVKDSDNLVKTSRLTANAIVGIDLEKFPREINRLTAKSYMIVNEQENIIDIIEKKIKSQFICIGMYGFENTEIFVDAYKKLKTRQSSLKEIYISHVVSYLIGTGISTFKYVKADDYEDWGTLEDWRITQKKSSTYFVNFDGVLVKNQSRYGIDNWNYDFDEIIDNIKIVKALYDGGAQIIITTTRGTEYKEQINKFLEQKGILVHDIITDCNFAPQIIINDFSPSNPYPSCSAINIPRNSNLGEYM